MRPLAVLQVFLACAILSSVALAFRVSVELRRRQESIARARASLGQAGARVEAHRRELRQAQALKDQFLATVSHELRTPLNAIVGWAHVLKAGTLTPAQQMKAIDAIERNARAEARLINDLLDLSQMARGQLPVERRPVGLGRVLRTAVEAMGPAYAARAVALNYVEEDAEAYVLGDAGRIEEAVSHLLTNALRFTPGGGRVELRLSRDDGFAVISVRDTGEGVEAGALPYVFQPFFQAATVRKREGLGLGLTLVREIASSHGGTVDASSEGPHRGAVFTIRLPRSQAGAWRAE